MRLKLEEIWKKNLGVNTVSEEDDFYKHNGNSLKLIKLFSSICNELGIELDAAEYLEELTFGTLLAAVEKEK